MDVITGATGHTGSVAAEKLLAAGRKVRVADAEALEKAFAGATAAYALIPPNLSAPDVRSYQEKVSDNLAAAIRKNRVSHAVVLSSTGVDKPSGTGPVVGLRSLEQKLSSIDGLNALFVRAGYFMENLLAQVSVIPTLGSMAGPVRSDLALPMIATRDIGAAVADWMLKQDFTGKQARELLGARNVSYEEVAKIVGPAIGKPGLGYRQAPAAMLKPALMQLGMSSNMVDLLLEMTEALNAGYMRPLEPRSAANTTPTAVETFVAEVFVPAYRGRAAGA